jgi:microcystin-dependent protein
MSEPFLAEIKIVAFDYAPRGWAHCNGQLLAINQNQALFSLLGTTYGGNGITNFALPDFRGRTPIHFAGNQHPLGQKGGSETHTLTLNELPAHSHSIRGLSSDADRTTPAASLLAHAAIETYAVSPATVPLHSGQTSDTGGNQPHDNMQPFLALNFVIALQGIFPSQN